MAGSRRWTPGRIGRRAARDAESALEDLLARNIPGSTLAEAFAKRLGREAGWLPPNRIAIAYALNQRLRQLADPTGGDRWLHYRWIGIFEEMWRDLDEAGARPEPPFTYVSMGPGTRNPYAFGLLVFLAGADRIWLVEPDRLDENWRAAWGLQELVLRLLTGSAKVDGIETDAARMGRYVDLDDLFFGAENTRLALGDDVHHLETGFEHAQIPDASVDFLSSRSVLEHIVAWDECFETFRRIIRPGGVMYHDIDLTAHAAGDRLAHYRSDTPLPGINERRLGDHLDALTRSGFDTDVVRVARADPAELDRIHLAERFARYERDDLLCTRAVLIARRRHGE